MALPLVALLLAASTPERAALAASPTPPAKEPILVYLDEAKLLRLPPQTATLVVGNPLVADVSVQPGGILVVTGKGYGTTNVMALDRTGAVLMDHKVAVQGPRDQVVVVFRGVERESYSCMPNCERRIVLGDSAAYFTTTLTQTGTLNLQAQGTQAAAASR